MNVLISRNQRAARAAGSVVTLDSLLPLLTAHRRDKQRIVFTNGCFDLLHAGHLRLLKEAAALGEVLVVAVNSDESVRRLKVPTRPAVPAEERARLIAEVAGVDYVLVFNDLTPHRLLQAIQPDTLVKGGDYTMAEVVGREMVEAYGGRVCLTSRLKGASTTLMLGNSG